MLTRTPPLFARKSAAPSPPPPTQFSRSQHQHQQQQNLYGQPRKKWPARPLLLPFTRPAAPAPAPAATATAFKPWGKLAPKSQWISTGEVGQAGHSEAEDEDEARTTRDGRQASQRPRPRMRARESHHCPDYVPEFVWRLSNYVMAHHVQWESPGTTDEGESQNGFFPILEPLNLRTAGYLWTARRSEPTNQRILHSSSCEPPAAAFGSGAAPAQFSSPSPTLTCYDHVSLPRSMSSAFFPAFLWPPPLLRFAHQLLLV
ncbi:hypothetical protein AXG93_2471s1110 [Marchantia polymorpha subsp. ruderalis]|uniref:Uncharacterized protein n=1 Tax=Marchantia polymorpha subsp. ruderalis TaxID=1480154 RepID=A0A176W2A0_MARPO|nr:hypothetical protein AXG93_2471s1110 [Marchantia polymorpha subsp. ruderalis]